MVTKVKPKTGDIKFVTLFRTAAGKNYIKFSYSEVERDTQILAETKAGNTMVKSYDRSEGEVR